MPSLAVGGVRPASVHPRRSCRAKLQVAAALPPSENLSNSATNSPVQPLLASPPSKLTFNLLLSDVDGTCVHYNSPIGLGSDSKRPAILQLPPSKTGAYGVISVRTLQLYAVIRTLGVRVVLISGARLSTVLQRLPFLPAVDAIVAESGGRIYYPGSLPTAAPLQEDTEWRLLHATAAGLPGQDAVPPKERSGLLWRFYAALEDGKVPGVKGAKLDATSYTTAFRVRLADPHQVSALQAALPPGLTSAGNLGNLDVFPATSGKENAALWLMHRFGMEPSDCVLMCDDDNDLKLAQLVRRAYLPGITAETVAEAVRQAPERFHVSQSQGVWGTEELLELLISEHIAGGAGRQA